jgi:hypothetical protein
MRAAEVDNLVSELFDPDLPNVAPVSIRGRADFYGSLSREHIETDEIVGVRSVLVAPRANLDGLRVGETLTIDGDDYISRLIEVRGRGITAVVLGR